MLLAFERERWRIAVADFAKEDRVGKSALKARRVASRTAPGRTKKKKNRALYIITFISEVGHLCNPYYF